jgi:hypothetical protein
MHQEIWNWLNVIYLDTAAEKFSILETWPQETDRAIDSIIAYAISRFKLRWGYFWTQTLFDFTPHTRTCVTRWKERYSTGFWLSARRALFDKTMYFWRFCETASRYVYWSSSTEHYWCHLVPCLDASLCQHLHCADRRLISHRAVGRVKENIKARGDTSIRKGSTKQHGSPEPTVFERHLSFIMASTQWDPHRVWRGWTSNRPREPFSSTATGAHTTISYKILNLKISSKQCIQPL